MTAEVRCAMPIAARRAHPARARFGVVLLTALLLGGCAVYGPGAPVEDRGEAPPPPPPPPATTTAPAPATPPPVSRPLPREEAPPAPAPRDPATLALLEQSDRALNAGKHDEAIAYVERALRIHGDDVELWLRLAELQLAASQPARAEQLAQRAIAMAGSRTDWQRRGWLIIADARDAQGDREEAERIRFEWRTFRG